MRITPLASGSLGNALLLEGGGARILIDGGLHVDELERRLDAVGVRPRQVDGIFVTHRHKDHIRGVTDFARRHRTKIWTTRRTAKSIGTEAHRRLRRIDFDRPFAVGDLMLRAVRVPHDAPDTAALVAQTASVRFGYATDLGEVEDHLVEAFARCDGLFVESNHDRAMLEAGEDPPHLKRRIASATGHLANVQAADLLGRVRHRGLRQVWLAHLSRRNNRPEQALAATRAVIPEVPITVATQDEPSPSVDLHPIGDSCE